jgi:hypothetical protein
MQNQLRDRSLTDRLVLIDEEPKRTSPSYFEWCERTVRTGTYRPAQKPQPKTNSIVRLLRRFG